MDTFGRADLMRFQSIPPISLLPGSRLTDVVAREYDWLFDFTNGVYILAESHWRLIDGSRLVVTNGDDGHWFGNGEPKDAAGVVIAELRDTDVSRVEFSPVADLTFWFTNGRSLQVLAGSCGYENWHVYGPGESHIHAIGGVLSRTVS